MTQGVANTSSLLIFYEADDDAVIVRYDEGCTSEADYSGELLVIAIFEDLNNFGSSDCTFTDANIV